MQKYNYTINKVAIGFDYNEKKQTNLHNSFYFQAVGEASYSLPNFWDLEDIKLNFSTDHRVGYGCNNAFSDETDVYLSASYQLCALGSIGNVIGSISDGVAGCFSGLCADDCADDEERGLLDFSNPTAHMKLGKFTTKNPLVGRNASDHDERISLGVDAAVQLNGFEIEVAGNSCKDLSAAYFMGTNETCETFSQLKVSDNSTIGTIVFADNAEIALLVAGDRIIRAAAIDASGAVTRAKQEFIVVTATAPNTVTVTGQTAADIAATEVLTSERGYVENNISGYRLNLKLGRYGHIGYEDITTENKVSAASDDIKQTKLCVRLGGCDQVDGCLDQVNRGLFDFGGLLNKLSLDYIQSGNTVGSGTETEQNIIAVQYKLSDQMSLMYGQKDDKSNSKKSDIYGLNYKSMLNGSCPVVYKVRGQSKGAVEDHTKLSIQACIPTNLVQYTNQE